MRVNGGAWQKLEHTKMTDPTVSRIIYWNKTNDNSAIYEKKTPMRNTASPHIWCGRMPENDLGKVCLIEIEAFDNFGLRTFAKRIVRILHF
jgi:hypothetical protein